MQTWGMFAAHRVYRQVDVEFAYIGDDPRYVEMHGGDPVPVVVTEDPEGIYYGWLDARQPERAPVMIQSRRSMFDMQFPYGPEVEEARGKGRIVRLTVVRCAT